MVGASPSGPLLVFDFDGVLVDGMREYWWSARRAALGLAPSLSLPEEPPAGFARLRPLIHHGWEMVLMAAELGRADGNLAGLLADYDGALKPALARWGWSPQQLQGALESVRSEAIASDRSSWLALHRFFPGVPERLAALGQEGAAPRLGVHKAVRSRHHAVNPEHLRIPADRVGEDVPFPDAERL